MDQCRKLLRRKLSSSKTFREDIAQFDREEGKPDGDRHYQHFLNAIDRYLRRVGQNGQQTAFEGQINAQIQLMASGKKLTMAAINTFLAAQGRGTEKQAKEKAVEMVAVKANARAKAVAKAVCSHLQACSPILLVS